MAYIKVPIEFFDSRKMRKYQELSGDWSTGLPIRALCIAAKEDALDGRLEIPSTDTLETFLGWRGRKGRGEQALIESGLIHKDESGYRINGWQESQGHIRYWHEKAKKAGKASHRRVLVDAQS